MVSAGLQIYPESKRDGYEIVGRGSGERDLKKEGQGPAKVC